MEKKREGGKGGAKDGGRNNGSEVFQRCGSTRERRESTRQEEKPRRPEEGWK